MSDPPASDSVSPQVPGDSHGLAGLVYTVLTVGTRTVHNGRATGRHLWTISASLTAFNFVSSSLVV